TRPVGEQLVGFSGPKKDCCDSVPIAPESLVAKGTAFACPGGSVSLSPEPKIRLAPHRLPTRTRGLLRLRLPGSPELVSEHLRLRWPAMRHEPNRWLRNEGEWRTSSIQSMN